MPGRDGNGPRGNGIPGRGMGPCGGGMRNGRGAGFGGGARASLPNNPPLQDMYPYTKEELEAQKKELEAQLKWINNQLDKDE